MTSMVNLGDVDFDQRRGGAERDALWKYLTTLVNESLQHWQIKGVLSNGLAGEPRNAFGLVVKVVDKQHHGGTADLGDPYSLFDFAMVHGNGLRFVFRALGKQLATVRTRCNTAELSEANFQNVVTDEDMDRPDAQLGEYPHAGGVVVQNGRYCVYVGLSGFTGRQDHIVGSFIGDMTLDKLTVLDDASSTESESSDTGVVASGG